MLDHQPVAVLLDQRLDDNAHFLGQVAEIDLLQIDVHPAGLDLGQVEDAVDQPEQMLSSGLDFLQVPYACFVATISGVLGQDFAVADDSVAR